MGFLRFLVLLQDIRHTGQKDGEKLNVHKKFFANFWEDSRRRSRPHLREKKYDMPHSREVLFHPCVPFPQGEGKIFFEVNMKKEKNSISF